MAPDIVLKLCQVVGLQGCGLFGRSPVSLELTAISGAPEAIRAPSYAVWAAGHPASAGTARRGRSAASRPGMIGNSASLPGSVRRPSSSTSSQSIRIRRRSTPPMRIVTSYGPDGRIGRRVKVILPNPEAPPARPCCARAAWPRPCARRQEISAVLGFCLRLGGRHCSGLAHDLVAEPTIADDRHCRPDRPGHSSDRSFRAASSDEAGFWPVTSLPSITTKEAQSSPFRY